MDNTEKYEVGGIVAILVLFFIWITSKLKTATPNAQITTKLGGNLIPAAAKTASAANVKARAMGPAIRLYQNGQWVWTAPVGAHVEMASDGTYWAVRDNQGNPQVRQGDATTASWWSGPSTMPAPFPCPGETYDDTGNVVSGTNSFPPIARGPSGSLDPCFNNPTADQTAPTDAGTLWS